jgi:sigma-E factor negative regulatory protein RseB
MRTLRLNHAISGWKRLPAFLLCAAALLSVQFPEAFAQQSADPAATHRSAADWLDRVQQAAQQQNYEGTFVYQRGGFVQSSRIAHYATSTGGELEQIDSLDGKPRKLLRRNDDIYTFVPERKLCVVEHRQTRDSFPALLGASGEHVMSVYDAKLLGSDRVAGLDAQVVEFVPKDAYRFAYKLWADPRTGLLLRSQTLDTDDRVLEQIAFSQVRIGGAAAAGDKSAIAAGMRNLGGWTVVRPPVAPVDMEAEGWQIAPAVAGFQKIREVRRPMASREPGDAPVPVDQAVFTDGLATISVFVEPADKSARKEGAGSTGATHVLVKRRGDFWITVLGEVPLATLQQFASAIEYKASK